jgi:hypothetical protein
MNQLNSILGYGKNSVSTTTNKTINQMKGYGEKIKNNNFSFELIAIGVFVFIYILVRLTESYIIPLIPEFIRTETSALFRWSHVILPIVIGFAYYKVPKHKYINTSDELLKERMKSILK